MSRLHRELITTDPDHSFRLLLTPHLESVFLWHYHPEYEIVYIEGVDGNRHIGEHLERYQGSDLALIGPYVPHLNFDYGVPRQHIKVVVQFHADFLGPDLWQKPEMADIRRLFEAARGAAFFTGPTKARVGEMLKTLPEQPPFRQILTLLEEFQIMAEHTEDTTLLRQSPISGEQAFLEQARLKRVREYVAQHYQENIDLRTILSLVNLSDAAFCRWFKKSTGGTFTDYVNQYRIVQAKQALLRGATVTDACFGHGFGNLSYFNKTFKKYTGKNPSEWRMGNGK